MNFFGDFIFARLVNELFLLNFDKILQESEEDSGSENEFVPSEEEIEVS